MIPRWAPALALALAALAGGCAQAADGEGDRRAGPDGDDAARAGAAATDRWRALAHSPLQRSEVGAARVGRFIYVAGGFLPSTDTTGQVARYDTEQDSWGLVRPVPVGVNHPGVAAAGGYLYVHGGYTADGSLVDPTARLYRYNPQTNGWKRLRNSADARAAHTIEALGGRLYAVGGVVDGSATASMEVYDIAHNRWGPAPAMHVAREHLTGVAFDGGVWVLAGRAAGHGNYRTVDRYSVANHRWHRLSPMQVARGGIASALVGGKIVVFGGEELGPGGTTIAEVELYDPGSDSWTFLPEMRTPRHGLGGASRGRRVYSLEGGTTPGFSFSARNEYLDIP